MLCSVFGTVIWKVYRETDRERDDALLFFWDCRLEGTSAKGVLLIECATYHKTTHSNQENTFYSQNTTRQHILYLHPIRQHILIKRTHTIPKIPQDNTLCVLLIRMCSPHFLLFCFVYFVCMYLFYVAIYIYIYILYTCNFYVYLSSVFGTMATHTCTHIHIYTYTHTHREIGKNDQRLPSPNSRRWLANGCTNLRFQAQKQNSKVLSIPFSGTIF